LSATANGSTSQRSQQLTVTANGGQQASATLSQSAGDPSLSINPASITLDWEGAAVSTTVTANGNWTVE
jgi:hypothetical protein